MTTETLTPVTPEVVTPIKPSEAIRLGCLIAPIQITGRFFDGRGGACALGAMALGFGYDGPQIDSESPENSEFSDPYCFVEDRMPGPPGYARKWTDSIYQLNDSMDWSRERIADWLAEQGL